MAKKQICIRTFPSSFINPTKTLNEYLQKGYIVVMCNPFSAEKPNAYGNEYILEKEVADNGE